MIKKKNIFKEGFSDLMCLNLPTFHARWM